MHNRFKNAGRGVLLLSALFATHSATADMGIGIRAGTMGGGLDFNIGMTESLALRLGYNYLSYDQTVEDTDVRYDGTIEVSSFSALLDWHVAGSGFRFSLGAVSNGPKIDVDGTPQPGEQVVINGNPYDRSQLGSLRGEIKIGNSVAPYVGLGYGNVVSEKHRITFLFDLGAIYGGTPDVKLTAVCDPAVPALVCTQLQNDVRAEMEELKAEASTIEWYPVINVGIGIRF